MKHSHRWMKTMAGFLAAVLLLGDGSAGAFPGRPTYNYDSNETNNSVFNGRDNGVTGRVRAHDSNDNYLLTARGRNTRRGRLCSLVHFDWESTTGHLDSRNLVNCRSTIDQNLSGRDSRAPIADVQRVAVCAIKTHASTINGRACNFDDADGRQDRFGRHPQLGRVAFAEVIDDNRDGVINGNDFSRCAMRIRRISTSGSWAVNSSGGAISEPTGC